MAYPLSFALDLGTPGLTLNAALTSAGVIDSTFRDVTATFYADGQGGYEFATAAIPDGYRGMMVFYTGTVGVASDFNGVDIQSRASVNPQEVENTDLKTSTRSSHTAADVWAAATRTLTAISDSSGITTLLSRIGAALTITGGKVDVNDKTGFALATAPPTAGAIATQVDTTLSGTHGGGAWGGGGSGLTAQQVRDAMKLAPSGGAPAEDSVDDKLDDLVPSGGTGAYAVTVRVTDGTTPLQNAAVRVTEGATTIALLTDVGGNAQFALDAATWQVAVTKAGYSFAPTTRTVTGAQAGTLTSDLVMAAVSIPAPALPTQTTGWLDTFDGHGAVEDGVVISFRMIAPPDGSARSYPMDEFTATSAGGGRLTVTLEQNAIYTAKRVGGDPVTFAASSGTETALPSILGSPYYP